MSERVSATSPSDRSRRWQALLVLIAAGYFSFFVFHPEWLLSVGVNYFGVWFLDSFAILASNDALSRGLDVYAANPLDYLQRPHVYPHWWLELRRLGLTRADNFWVGLTLVSAFFIGAVARLRPRTLPEMGWYLAVLCTSPVLLAIHRANNDLVIFLVLLPVVPCLLSSRRSLRLLAVLCIAVATALKFYPAAGALVLLAGGEVREVRARVGLTTLALSLAGLGLARDFTVITALAQKAEGLMTFGAGNLIEVFGLSGWRVTVAGLMVAGVIAVVFFRTEKFSGWIPSAADQSAWLGFVLGAALLTGCFFTGMNFAYRWVFAVWLAPFLWRTGHEAAAPAAVRRFASVTAVLLSAVLWIDPLASVVLTRVVHHVPGSQLVHWADRIFLFEQPVTWAFFACLIGWLVLFIRECAGFILAGRN